MLCVAIRRSLHPCNVQLNAPPVYPHPAALPPSHPRHPTNQHTQPRGRLDPTSHRTADHFAKYWDKSIGKDGNWSVLDDVKVWFNE